MLSNLITLKTHVLPAEEVGGADFDSALQILGSGIARQLEQYCHRRFERATGLQAEIQADRSFVALPVYPIETVTAAELRATRDDSWADISGRITHLNEEAGLVYFDSIVGPYMSRIRITWDGGYWFDSTEDESGTQPGGSTLLPDDLKLAWLQQCAFAWQQTEKLGIPLEGMPPADKQKGASGLEQIALLPAVKETLKNYQRLA